MLNQIEQITKYITQEKEHINSMYKPRIHFAPEVGWLNDPNGFSFDGAFYHLFYQFHPFSSKNELMYWGHAKSKNLVDWTHLDVALVPDKEYDKSGVFSGSILIENETFYTYYTGHVVENDKVTQTQCLAISTDGIHFEKYQNNPIIDNLTLPSNTVIEDFRDPKILKRDNQYILMMGSRTLNYRGQILFYTSDDLIHFQYKNRMILDEKYGDVVECPDLFHIDQMDVLVFSTQNAKLIDSVQNKFSVFLFLGEFDSVNCSFNIKQEQLMDYGFDFYAPQVVYDGQNHIMIGWMNSWERTQVTDAINHGWNGSMTFPRQLKLENGDLKQKFISTNSIRKNVIEDNRSFTLKQNDRYSYQVGNVGIISFNLELKKDTFLELDCFSSKDSKFIIEFDGRLNEVRINREHAKHKIKSTLNEMQYDRRLAIDSKIAVEILLDTSSIEVIINGSSMSSLFYGESNTECSMTSNHDLVLKNLMIQKFL